ncbi:MAG: hypothetical protein ACI923_001581, partial [Flavobacteriales bacterium]
FIPNVAMKIFRGKASHDALIATRFTHRYEN